MIAFQLYNYDVSFWVTPASSELGQINRVQPGTAAAARGLGSGNRTVLTLHVI